MAKKTSSNAIKKVDDQIKTLESGSKKIDSRSVKKSPVKKSGTKSSSVSQKNTRTKRDTVVVAADKKSKNTNTRKTTSSKNKNIRGGVVAPKKNVTKTIEKEQIKNDLQSLKGKDKVEIVVDRDEKNKKMVEEVNKILEIETSDSIPTSLETPKFIQEEKPKEKELVKNKEAKLKEFFMLEDSEPSNTSISLDDVDVIKFDSDKKDAKTKKGHLKKKEKANANDLDQIDKLDEYKIVRDFEKDLPTKKKTAAKKQDFSRKRKGKGYVVHIRKKPTYQELESDLRQLYDKVNDVVGDIDENVDREELPISKKTTKKKSGFSLFKKKEKKEKPVVKTKKVKVTKKPVVEEVIPGERPSILDHISQKVLNFFLIVLFTIFFLMVIAFIGFVIYVSTF